MEFLKDFNKAVDKMEGVSSDTSPPRYWFGSGNYVLNKIVSGSYYNCIPQGRVTCFAGPSGSGKSFLAANIIKQAQKEGAYILLLDSEGAFDDDFASAIGIDTDRSMYNPKQVTTIPQVTKIVSNFTKGYKKEFSDDPLNAPKVLIVIDSLDMLMTETEADKYEKGDTNADQGQHPKQLKQMLKTYVNDLKGFNISMVVTKQVYAAGQAQILKGEGVWVVNDAIRYSTSQIVLITKLKLRDGVGAGAEVNGIRMKCEAFKTRFAKPFQSVSIEVPYDTGMDAASGLAEVAESLGIITKKGAWQYLTGSDLKWQGAHNMPRDIIPDIVKACEEKQNVFLSLSNEDAALEDIPDVPNHRILGVPDTI
jgi:RecA/RadA recombinase